MPRAKPRTIVKGRVYRRLVSGPPLNRFYRRRRAMYNPMPVFTETADFGSQVIPPGSVPFLGQLNCTLNSIPQMGNYRALYNQARILKVQFLLVPNFTEYAQQADVLSPNFSVTVPRMVYAIQDTANAQPPTSELDVLTDNGCKIKHFNKPIKITCRPVASLQQQSTLGGFASVTKRRQWLTTDATGITVPHIGVNYAITQDAKNTANPQAQWNVYAKITFQLRDPK